MDSTAKIRALNDALRAIAAGNGRIYVTAGIAALPNRSAVFLRLIARSSVVRIHP
jgi:hypothetical protein